MQAIQTRYHGPTDHNGSRITARCDAGRVTVPYDHALGLPENHDAAADALIRKLGWTGRYVSGALPDGSYVHVLAVPARRVVPL
jgi:hypothetical protein